MTKASLIKAELSKLVLRLLFEDRKNDKALPIDSIEQAILDGEIEIDDLITYIKEDIMLSIYEYQTEQRTG